MLRCRSQSLDSDMHDGAKNSWPGWQSTIRSSPSASGLTSDRDELAPTMDSVEEEPQESHPSFEFFVSLLVTHHLLVTRPCSPVNDQSRPKSRSSDEAQVSPLTEEPRLISVRRQLGTSCSGASSRWP